MASPLARADVLLPPPNIILPNYDRTLVGNIPSLEAGAYGSRANDASSNWYNPAGLMHAKKTVINASSSAYRVTGVKAETGNTTTGASTGAQPPSFLGLVLAPPVLGSDHVRFGFSVTNETYWAPVLQTRVNQTTAAGDDQRFLYSTRDYFTETFPAFAMAYAPSESLRVGGAVAVDIVSYQANDSLSGQQTNATSQEISYRGSQISANSMNVVFSAGTQYDLAERWKLSLTLKSPSLRLNGSSKVTIENIRNASGTTTDTAFFDMAGRFAYSRPFQAGIGVAYVAPAFEIELDARYHAAIGPYTAFSSSQPIVTTSNTGGAPTTTNSSINDVVNQYRNVVNVAIGTRFKLTESFDLHGGFFTSKSPLADGDSSIFRKVDLYGITLGAAFKIGSVSGSLGGAYEFGKSDPYQVPNANGAPLVTTVSVTSISLLYAVSLSL